MCRNCPVFTDTHDSVLLSGFSLAHIEFFSYAHQHHHRHRAHSFFLIDNCKYAVIVVCARFFLFYLLAVNFIHSRWKQNNCAHCWTKQTELNWLDLIEHRVKSIYLCSVLYWMKGISLQANCGCILRNGNSAHFIRIVGVYCVCVCVLFCYEISECFNISQRISVHYFMYVSLCLWSYMLVCILFKMQIVHLSRIWFEKKLFFPSPWIEHFVVLTNWFEFCI